MGVDVFYSLIDALFPSGDEFFLEPGAPDLLLWHPDGTSGAWFFAEVKGPGDSLRSTQKAWLISNRECLRGHYLLVVLQ